MRTLSDEPDNVIIISSIFVLVFKEIISFVCCINVSLSCTVIRLKSKLSKVNVVLTSSIDGGF